MSSSSRNQLIKLENKDCHLFHGSGLKLARLEPRQAHTFVDGTKKPDGEPAIFASNLADFAIFMALINKQTCSLGLRSGCRYEDDRLIFSASKGTLAQLNDKTHGYVHVFKRSDFALRGGVEWWCHKPVNPLKIIEVRLSDFIPEIVDMPSTDSSGI